MRKGRPMPEWLQTSMANGSDPSLTVLAWRIGMAMVLGTAVAVIYRWARRGEAVQPTFLTTLVLLATVIAMATQVIGDNVARAFSLVGALSVVRFRTVVKDTQDTAFVIFAVVVGMASGANHLVVALVGMGIVAAASLVLWPRRRSDGWVAAESTLALRITPDAGVQAATELLLAASTERCDLTSVATARQGAALDLSYRVRLRVGCLPSALVAELHGIKGVESVDLRRES
jgi:Domain of unknown function (DUF4956)